MERGKNRRLVVVLGAPRSGFAAMTSVLDFLGVRFEPNQSEGGHGLNLAPEGSEGDVNQRLLTHLGADWQRLTGSSLEVPADSTIGHLRVAAFQFLSRMTERERVFGLKDPRTTRLLAFWKTVFSGISGEVGFVLMVRDPASATASLATRDSVPAEKAYFLWLQHVLPSVLLTRGAPRVVVDYDLFLREPRAQITRISQALALPMIDAESPRFKDLESRLVESGRRHAHSREGDLAADRRASSLVAPVHRMLHRLAADQESLDRPDVHAAFEGWSQQLAQLAPAFEYINALEAANRHLRRIEAEHEIETAQVKHALEVRTQALTERDQQVSRLQPVAMIANSELARRQDETIRLARDIAAMKTSTSWRITKPLRAMTLLAKGQWSDIGTEPAPPTPEDFGPIVTPLPPPPAPLSALDQVPPGFDPRLYLDLHPDLNGSEEWAAEHYLNHGRHEGRGFTLPEIDLLTEEGFRSGRETILVVSHEASRTGAPLLSLGLVQANADRYNVVALLLGEGPLCDAFRKAGAAVVMSPRMKGNPVVTEVVIRRLHARFDFRFALVNSIESRATLPALGQHCIPSVALLHEFAAYTRPATAFRDAFFWSSEVVFSTKLTLQNAHDEIPDLSDRAVHVLPQGRCIVPAEGLTEEQLRAEQRRIRRLMRPGGAEDGAVVVLGAGTVHIRKGVDLFIQCAARARLAAPHVDYRFVWMGAGYNPAWDAAYSVYVADQIRRAGLEEHIVFIDESAAIETAYEEADLFLLTSRLDPLPNVAIESMAFGLPVLCFDKTTGIADFLIGAGLENHCVAKFLDSADMAEKLLTLAASKTLREEVGARSREASTAFFDTATYFAGIDAVAETAVARTHGEEEDARVILESGVFRPDFATQPYLASLNMSQSIRRHVRAWASGIDMRKPFPGFHPGVYQERHGLAAGNADPLADYLRAGRPDGPWNSPVISDDGMDDRILPEGLRVALHLHVHYPELLRQITPRLSLSRTLPDLFVSVTSERVRAAVAGPLGDYRGRVVEVQTVPNRGRDIGPLLTGFGKTILADYEFIGHLHTKKSAAVKDAAMGEAWFQFLLENLIGNEAGAMTDRILAAMSEDPSIGMVFPDDPHVVGWNENRAIAESVARRIGATPLPDHWNFPVGSMFWARTAALAPFISLDLGWDDYPEEPLEYDGTLLHAIERLLPLALPPGLRIATTNVPGCTR